MWSFPSGFCHVHSGFKIFSASPEVKIPTFKTGSETLLLWRKAFLAHGLAGLTDKTTRPKSFGNKIPAWIKEHLIALFFQFPCWTPYQYHSYLKHNPAIHWYVSLPTIQKLKTMTTTRSKDEKDRLRKRWCFQKGTKAWTVDSTCILKTDHFKLQLLTVSDARSRFLFETALFLETSTELVVDHLVELFSRYGKPDFVKADNGSEFRTECEDQLRDLCVYLLNSPTYYGQFCGAHERIHRTLKTHISDFGNLDSRIIFYIITIKVILLPEPAPM